MKIICNVLLCAILTACLCISPVQATISGLNSVPMQADQQASYIDNENLKMVMYDGCSGGIRCFDVADNGHYALGFGSDNRCKINVYNASGAFLYAYEFCAVGVYGIQFCDDSDNLAIYSSRGRCYTVYDPSGVCQEARNIVQSDSSLKLESAILNREHKIAAGKSYTLERDIDIGPEYSRFVVTNEDGERTILFDRTADILVKQIIGIVCVVSFFTLVVLIAVKKSKEKGTW